MIYFLTLFISLSFLADESEATLLNNCTVFTSQNRSCTGSNCALTQSNQYAFSVCPILTQSQINQVVESRKTTQTSDLEKISNSTSQALQQIEETYKSKIQTSKSLGYIAGISIGVIFLIPTMFDLMNLMTGFSTTVKSPKPTIKPKKFVYHH